jgi:hypothetical protein
MHSADILPTSTHFALETQSVYLGGKTPFSQKVLSLFLLQSPFLKLINNERAFYNLLFSLK